MEGYLLSHELNKINGKMELKDKLVLLQKISKYMHCCFLTCISVNFFEHPRVIVVQRLRFGDGVFVDWLQRGSFMIVFHPECSVDKVIAIPGPVGQKSFVLNLWIKCITKARAL